MHAGRIFQTSDSHAHVTQSRQRRLFADATIVSVVQSYAAIFPTFMIERIPLEFRSPKVVGSMMPHSAAFAYAGALGD
jgi:hypothetical protein